MNCFLFTIFTDDFDYDDIDLIGAMGSEVDNIDYEFQEAQVRLEQGRLYQMLLKHDLFDGVDADARAMKNVQNEIREFMRESYYF